MSEIAALVLNRTLKAGWMAGLKYSGTRISHVLNNARLLAFYSRDAVGIVFSAWIDIHGFINRCSKIRLRCQLGQVRTRNLYLKAGFIKRCSYYVKVFCVHVNSFL